MWKEAGVLAVLLVSTGSLAQRSQDRSSAENRLNRAERREDKREDRRDQLRENRDERRQEKKDQKRNEKLENRAEKREERKDEFRENRQDRKEEKKERRADRKLRNREFNAVEPIYMINEFQWQSGYPDGIENGTSMDRSAWQVRSMLHTIICGNDPNCPFAKTDFFRALNNYACNCFSKTSPSVIDPNVDWTHMAHIGPAINEIDQACIDVHNAYLCMFMDADEGILKQGRTTALDGSKIEGCYEGMPFTYHVGGDGKIICGPASNPEYARNKWNGCRQAACEIERHFAYTVANQLADPLVFKDQANQDNLYFWNPVRKANMCRGDGLGVKRNKDQCCGEFPTRYPFASDTFECCGTDGKNKPFGEC